MTMSKRVGIYIHVPFCLRKCHYCDFCSFVGVGEGVRRAYATALCEELRAYRPYAAGYEVDTVYFGGGTPSLLAAEDMARVLGAIREVFSVREDAEITAEVNPKTADRELLSRWRELGICRLSIGVQSFDDGELSALGRLHTAREAEELFSLARKTGFENVTIDLMYAIPTQTRESFRRTLRRAIALRPDHISAYGLKIEEGTPFAERVEELHLPDGDAEADLYMDCVRILGEAGYRHYEISNYALPGRESRHNLRYWQMGEYIGIGVAAHSYFDGRRYGHSRDLAAYLSCPRPTLDTQEKQTEEEREYETVMLALRTADGIDERVFRAAFGYGFREKYAARLAPLAEAGLVLYEGEHTRLSDGAMYVCLAVLGHLLDGE